MKYFSENFYKVFALFLFFSFPFDSIVAEGLPSKTYPAGTLLSKIDRGFRITFWHKGYWYIPGGRGPETVLDISNPESPQIVFSQNFGSSNGHVGAMIGDYVTHSLGPARLRNSNSGWIDLTDLPIVKTLDPSISPLPGFENKKRGNEYHHPSFFPYQDELLFKRRTYSLHEAAGIGRGREIVLGNLLIAISGKIDQGGVATWDISNPDAPKLLDVLKGPYIQYSGGRQIYKHHVLLLNSENKHNGKRTDLIGIDFSDPNNLKLSYTIDNYPFTRYLQVQDEFIFGANANHGFKYDMEQRKEVLGFDPPVINGKKLGLSDFWWLPVGHLVLMSGDGPRSMIFSHQDTLDRRAPFVAHHVPANNAVNQHPKSRIAIVIHETLDKNSINTNTVTVRPANGGAKVSGLVSWSTYDVITFSPFEPLQPNTTYVVEVVPGGIKDAAGNGVAGYSFKFSTGNKIDGGDISTPTPRPTIAMPTPTFTPTITPRPAPTNRPLPTNTPRPTPTANPGSNLSVSSISISPSRMLRIGQEASFFVNAIGGIGNRTFKWDFGDGGSATRFNTNTITHKFKRGGTFEISLEVKDRGGALVKRKEQVVVRDNDNTIYPTPTLSAPISTPTKTPRPTNTPRATDTPIINPTPKLAININKINISGALPIVIKNNYTISVDASGGAGKLKYSWQFGDGITTKISENSSTSHSYAKDGPYTIIVKVEDQDGNAKFASKDVLVQIDRVDSKLVKNSHSFAISSNGDALYSANIDNNSLAFVDLNSRKLIKEVNTGEHPNSVAVLSSGDIAVTTESDDSIWVYDTTAEPKSQVQLEWGCQPYGLIAGISNTGYVTCSGSGQLLKVDFSKRQVIGSLDLAMSIKGLALNLKTNKLYVTRFISTDSGGELFTVDAGSFQLIDKTIFKVDSTSIDDVESARGLPNYLSAIVVDPIHQTAWIGGKKDNILAGIFRDKTKLTPSTTVRSFLSSFSLSNLKENEQDRIDIDDLGLITALDITTDGIYLAAVLQTNNKLIIINALNGTVVSSIDTGKAPESVIIDRETNRIYVHNMIDRTVQIFDATKLFTSGTPEINLVASIKTITQEQLSKEELLGKEIFYNASDVRMSLDGYMSCATCHMDGTHDGRTWDFTQRGQGLRNTTSLRGASGDLVGHIHWTGNFDEIQDFEHDIRNEFGGTGFIKDSKISEPLGAPKEGISKELDSLAIYLNSLNDFLRSSAKDSQGLFTQDARRGAAIFKALDCSSCHSGELYSDSFTGKLHNVGTTSIGSGSKEVLFDTPSLIGVLNTAPYFHDGSVQSLTDVFKSNAENSVHHVADQINPKLQTMLVEFLKQLDAKNVKVSDGLSESLEELASSAKSIDTDNDSLDDLLELYYFKTLVKDGSADTDNDGMSDKDEFLRGTDPLVADSSPDSDPKVSSPLPSPLPSPTTQKASLPLFINSGGVQSFDEKLGIAWSADTYFVGGNSIKLSSSDSIPTSTVRRNSSGYQIPVINGTYLVQLYFKEDKIEKTISTDSFAVSVEGGNDKNILLKNISRSKGKNVRTFFVKVIDGSLTVNFTSSGFTSIAALSVREVGEWFSEAGHSRTSRKLSSYTKKLAKIVKSNRFSYRKLQRVADYRSWIEFLTTALELSVDNSLSSKKIRRQRRRIKKAKRVVLKSYRKIKSV